MPHLYLKSICVALTAAAVTAQKPPVVPHLSQAWVAQSTGDGLPGEVGKESYLMEDCRPESDDCIEAHIFDYGASDCVKVEINAGFHSNATGAWLIKCDAVDCCYEGDQNGEPPDVKQWDIYHPNGHYDPLKPAVSYLGQQTATGLNGEVVPNASVWRESDRLPFTKDHINYTYYITFDNNGRDTISHRIDFFVPGANASSGAILYGDFQVQHDIAAFRETIKQYVPASCMEPNTMACNTAHKKKWNSKLPPSFGQKKIEV
jgi:hypothetical protein